MKKNDPIPCNEQENLSMKKNMVEAVNMFARLSPAAQDAIIDLVKALILQNQSNK